MTYYKLIKNTVYCIKIGYINIIESNDYDINMYHFKIIPRIHQFHDCFLLIIINPKIRKASVRDQNSSCFLPKIACKAVQRADCSNCVSTTARVEKKKK